MTVDEAIEHQIADYKVANHFRLYEELGYSPGQIVEVEQSMAEKAARIITRPYVTIILLTIGLLGLIAEIFLPGFGLPGTVGLLSLAIVFSSHIYYGLAGWGLAVLFLAGLILLAVEIL